MKRDISSELSLPKAIRFRIRSSREEPGDVDARPPHREENSVLRGNQVQLRLSQLILGVGEQQRFRFPSSLWWKSFFDRERTATEQISAASLPHSQASFRLARPQKSQLAIQRNPGGLS